MATAQETIVTGLQALKVLGFGQSPTTQWNVYCLRQLNSYLRQLAGFSGSIAFVDKRIDASYEITNAWPALRLQCVTGRSVTLPREPVDGFRVEVIDASGDAASSNITIERNGWRINGVASDYTISTDGGKVSLFFRGDTGNWALVDDLELADDLPFPEDFDEGVALNAALRYTIFGQSLSNDDRERAREGATRIRARYKKPPPARMDTAVANIGGGSNVISLNDFLSGNV